MAQLPQEIQMLNVRDQLQTLYNTGGQYYVNRMPTIGPNNMIIETPVVAASEVPNVLRLLSGQVSRSGSDNLLPESAASYGLAQQQSRFIPQAQYRFPASDRLARNIISSSIKDFYFSDADVRAAIQRYPNNDIDATKYLMENANVNGVPFAGLKPVSRRSLATKAAIAVQKVKLGITQRLPPGQRLSDQPGLAQFPEPADANTRAKFSNRRNGVFSKVRFFLAEAITTGAAAISAWNGEHGAAIAEEHKVSDAIRRQRSKDSSDLKRQAIANLPENERLAIKKAIAERKAIKRKVDKEFYYFASGINPSVGSLISKAPKYRRNEAQQDVDLAYLGQQQLLRSQLQVNQSGNYPTYPANVPFYPNASNRRSTRQPYVAGSSFKNIVAQSVQGRQNFQ